MTTPHVYIAINEVVAKMASEGLAKDRDNRIQGFKFRGIDDVYNALARHLANAKLCILPRVRERSYTERPTQKGGVQTFCILLVDFDLVSAVDGTSHTITTVGEAQDSADKSSNKAMSAAMKYACLVAFQIPTEGDNDADAHHEERAPPAPVRPSGQRSNAERPSTAKAAPSSSDFERRFNAVVDKKGTLAELRAIGADIARAVASGALDPLERDHLETVYMRAVDALGAAA